MERESLNSNLASAK